MQQRIEMNLLDHQERGCEVASVGQAATQPVFFRRAISSATLSAMFVLLYGFSNQLTEMLGQASVFRFEWESSIPFLAWMILPYMSLDLFFVSAPLLTRTSIELRNLERSVALSVLLSCALFLLVPLKFTFHKPAVSGVSGWVFQTFLQMDKPFNQMPSLHIVLSLILGEFYFCRFKGWLRWSAVIWFGLISASTVFTYQHHVIDLVGGTLTGSFFVLFFSSTTAARFRHERRIGLLYLLLSLTLALISIVKQGWALGFLWPAFSCAILGFAYFFDGVSLFSEGSLFTGESNIGRYLRLALLGPVLLGHRLSHIYYARVSRSRTSPWNVLTDRIWIGRWLFDSEAKKALHSGVGAVVDLSAELRESRSFRGLPYLQIPVLDLTSPGRQQIERAFDFIEHHSKSTIVFIHCKAGYSRTAALAGCWLLHSGLAKHADDAIAQLRSARPGIVIRPEAERRIREWEASV